MQKISKLSLLCLMSLLLISATACRSNNTSSNKAESQVTQTIPASSKFSKIQTGWSSKRVHDTIGEPTDSKSYTTGKMFIPFYFGSDMARFEELYKGEGRIIYAGGAGVTASGYTVYKIVYNPNESGYADKK